MPTRRLTLRGWQPCWQTDGPPSHPDRKEGGCTVSLAPVRSVHTDISMSKTPILWSHICPKTFLRKIVKWFSREKEFQITSILARENVPDAPAVFGVVRVVNYVCLYIRWIHLILEMTTNPFSAFQTSLQLFFNMQPHEVHHWKGSGRPRKKWLTQASADFSHYATYSTYTVYMIVIPTVTKIGNSLMLYRAGVCFSHRCVCFVSFQKAELIFKEFLSSLCPVEF